MLRSLFFGLREAPGSDFGAILARFWARCWKVFEAILRLLLRCVGGCSRCSSCWLASTFSVSSWRCASHVFSGLLRDRAGKPREKRRKTQEALPAQSAEAAARSAAARLQASVRARCLDALAVPLVVVLVLVGASSPSPLAVFAAIFALLLRLPCLRLSLGTRFPFHDSQVFGKALEEKNRNSQFTTIFRQPISCNEP